MESKRGFALEALVDVYENLQAAAQQVGQRDFSQRAMIASFQRVYERILGAGKPTRLQELEGR